MTFPWIWPIAFLNWTKERTVILRQTSGTKSTTRYYGILRGKRYYKILRGTKRYCEWYHESLWGTKSGATRYCKLYYESLWDATKGLRWCKWYYTSLQGITRGLRYCEWFFRSITRYQLHQLAVTFLMDKIKLVFILSSDSYILCFALLYL